MYFIEVPNRHKSTYYYYQRDVDISNLKEISDIIDGSMVGAIYDIWASHKILRATTMFADGPWWTARDESGTVVGEYPDPDRHNDVIKLSMHKY